MNIGSASDMTSFLSNFTAVIIRIGNFIANTTICGIHVYTIIIIGVIASIITYILYGSE